MSGLFGSRAQGEAWFRIGRVQFTSTLLVVALGAVGMVLCAFMPSLAMALSFQPQAVLSGEVWRLVTWPLVNLISFWSLLNLVLLWYFGTMLESTLGRNRMLRFYLEMWGALTIATALVGFVLPMSTALWGLRDIQFLVLLIWIADNPTRRFILNIPAWALGAFLLGLQVLTMVATRQWGPLVTLVLALFFVAVAARRHGLLSSLTFIPGGGSGGSPSKARAKAKAKPSARAQRQQQRHMSDEDRIDQLLDKISAQGIHSLTKAERAELEKLRKRRRSG
ncbi:MAG: rhomboid family intramembrane serine protease [Propionibacterium sp.]|nr:rhomboid family intramembrane serine protease [Propionibacterium sp.]